MSNWKIINGDCTEILRTIETASVDAVVTDPPYGISFKGEQFDEIANDDAPYVWWLREAARIIKPGGCLLCFCRWDVAEAFRLAIGWSGLKVRSQLVWDRELPGKGDVYGAPAPQHDTIWFATQGRYKLPNRRPSTVVRAQKVHSQGLRHPNEKPVRLMVDLVRAFVPAGGLVVDPFAGSGTTGEACVKLGMGFVGIELDSEYALVAHRRLTDTAPLFGG